MLVHLGFSITCSSLISCVVCSSFCLPYILTAELLITFYSSGDLCLFLPKPSLFVFFFNLLLFLVLFLKIIFYSFGCVWQELDRLVQQVPLMDEPSHHLLFIILFLFILSVAISHLFYRHICYFFTVLDSIYLTCYFLFHLLF